MEIAVRVIAEICLVLGVGGGHLLLVSIISPLTTHTNLDEGWGREDGGAKKIITARG